MQPTQEQLKEFWKTSLEGALPDVTKDTGGCGFCWDVCNEFVRFLGYGLPAWLDLRKETPGEYPLDQRTGYPGATEHCVVFIKGIAYDWTPGQFVQSPIFDFDVPTPYIYPVPQRFECKYWVTDYSEGIYIIRIRETSND